MKNLVIVVLIFTVGILGYLLLTNADDSNNSESTKTNSTENTQSSANGKSIDLSNQGLTEVPKDILDDKSVTTLDVSGNNLTGALPAEIRMLTNLEFLIASDNNLTGIPAEIGQLSKLRIANFANNDISGLPLEIGNLSNLETLDLTGNTNVSEFDISKIQPQIPNTQIITD